MKLKIVLLCSAVCVLCSACYGQWSKQSTRNGDNSTLGKFKSIVSLPAGGTTPAGDPWLEDQVYCVVERIIDGNTVTTIEEFTPQDWGPDNDYAWFVDGGGTGMAYQPGHAEIPEIPAVPATYTYTWISENGAIWGIPFGDQTCLTLDAGQPAVNLGGGIVGLPYTDNPFSSGDVVAITGTSNYDGSYTLTAGTTANQLQFAHGYFAETFAGTERAIRVIGSLDAGPGAAAQDDDGNLYYAHNWANSTYITKILPDGSIVYDAFTNPAWPKAGSPSIGTSVAITEDQTALYLWIRGTDGYMEKYNLVTGGLIWESPGEDGPAFDATIDNENNGWSLAGADLQKYAAADGARTAYDLYYKASAIGTQYDVHVDNELGIVVVGGYQAINWKLGTADLYNLWSYDLDGTNPQKACLGNVYLLGSIYVTPYIYKDFIASHDGFIYCLVLGESDIQVYKVNSSLAVVDSVAVSQYAIGLYFDLWDNLVVVNQDWIAGQSQVFDFYNTDLTYISGLDGFSDTMLRTWDSAVGSSWVQGNALPNGDLGTPGTPGQPGIPEAWVPGPGTQLDGASVCVYADGVPHGTFTMDGNDISDFNDADHTVVIAGLNYWSKLETMPLIIPGNEPNTVIADKQITAIKFDLQDTYFMQYAMGKDATVVDCNFGGITNSIVTYNRVAFPFGSRQKPTVFIKSDEPVPLGIRGMVPEVTFWRPK